MSEQNDLQTARDLMAQGRYDEARTILENSPLPEAADLLKDLAAKEAPAQPADDFFGFGSSDDGGIEIDFGASSFDSPAPSPSSSAAGSGGFELPDLAPSAGSEGSAGAFEFGSAPSTPASGRSGQAATLGTPAPEDSIADMVESVGTGLPNINMPSAGSSGSNQTTKILGLSIAAAVGLLGVVLVCICLCCCAFIFLIAQAEPCEGGVCLEDELRNAVNQGIIEPDQTVSGQLTQGRNAHLWTFQAESGRRYQVVLTRTSGDLDPELVIYQPNRVYLNHTYSLNRMSVELSFTASESGTYTIMVSNWGVDFDLRANYNLTLR